MAFPVGWTRKYFITCNHLLVGAGGVSGYPGLVTEANLPSEMLTSGGGNAAQADGGDIRFSSDSAGASQLACEIELWAQNANPALAKAVIWVNCALSSASDTPIYVWYNAGGAQTQPAAGAAFGSQAVWNSNFKAVYHLPNGSSLSANDSTSNAFNGTLFGATPTSGQIDGAAAFLASSSQYIKGANSNPTTGTLTVSAWIKSPPTGTVTIICNKDQSTPGTFRVWGFRKSSAEKLDFIVFRDNVTSAEKIGSVTIADNNWHYVVGTWDGSTINVFVDGSLDGAGVAFSGALNQQANNAFIGRGENSNPAYFTGSIDEVRISDSPRSPAWIQTEFNNQNSPGTFWTAGTPGPTGGSTQQQLSMLGCGA